MHLFARRPLAGAIACAAVAFGLVGCAPSGQDRPDPTHVVQRYLDAIASGDARTAAELDHTAVFGDASTSPSPEDDFTDEDSLRTDDVLAGAERIDAVVVAPETTGLVHDDVYDEERAVSFSFELAGERYDGMLPVGWDEDRGEWVLLDTIAEKVLIQARVSRIEAALVGFSAPGASVARPDDPSTAPIQWLMFPGVYTVTGDFDPSLLVDPALGVEREIVIADGDVQPSLIYELIALP